MAFNKNKFHELFYSTDEEKKKQEKERDRADNRSSDPGSRKSSAASSTSTTSTSQTTKKDVNTLGVGELEDSLIEEKKYGAKQALHDLPQRYTAPSRTRAFDGRDEFDSRVRQRYNDERRKRELEDILAGNSQINPQRQTYDYSLENSLIENKKYGTPVQYTEPQRSDLERARAIEYTNADNELYELNNKLQRQDWEREKAWTRERINSYDALLNNSDFEAYSQYYPQNTSGEIAPSRNYLAAFKNSYAATKNRNEYDFPLYDAVNGDKEAADLVGYKKAELLGGAYGVGAGYFQGAGYEGRASTKLSDKERKIFNYLYRTQGEEAAQNYFDLLKSDIYQELKEEDKAMWREYADKSVGNKIAASAFSVLTAPARVLQYASQLGDMMGDGRLDANNPMNWRFSEMRSNINEAVSANFSPFGRFFYNVGMSMADFLYTAALGAGVGAMAGTGALASSKLGEAFVLSVMGTEAAADTVVEKKKAGYDDQRAFILGTAAGVAEALSEKIGFDALFNTDLLEEGGKGIIKYILRQAASEGAEEGASDFINMFCDDMYDAFTGQTEAEWRRQIEEILRENPNMSYDTAFGVAMAKRWEEIGLDVAAGALSGLAMGGGSVAMNAMRGRFADNAQGKLAKKNGTAEDIVEAIIAQGEDNEITKHAKEIAEKLKAGKKPTNKELGNLITEWSRVSDLEDFIETGLRYPGTAYGRIAASLNEKIKNGTKVEDISQNDAEDLLVAYSNLVNELRTGQRSQYTAREQEYNRHAMQVNNSLAQIRNAEAVDDYAAASAAAQQVQQGREALRDLDTRAENPLSRYALTLPTVRDNIFSPRADSALKTIADIRDNVLNTQDTSLNAQEALESSAEPSEGATLATQENAAEANEEASIAETKRLVLPTVKENTNVRGKNDLRRSGQRNDGANPRIAVRAVEQNARLDTAGKISSAARDNQVSRLKVADNAESSSSFLKDGITDDAVYRVVSGETDSMRKGREAAAKYGLKVSYWTGGNLTAKGGREQAIRGTISGKEIAVRADHPDFTAEQLVWHEIGHHLIDTNRINKQDIISKTLKAPNLNWRSVLKKYGEVYRKISDMDERVATAYAEAYAGTNLLAENKLDDLLDEVICDAIGGMNIFEADRSVTDELRRDTAKVQRAIKEEADTQRARAPPAENLAAAKVGINIDADTESANPMHFSLETWRKSDYVTNREAAVKALKSALNVSAQYAGAYIDTVNSIANIIASDRVRYDYESSPGRSSFVSNSEYGGSIDFSTICKKRRELTGTFEAIQNALPNAVLSPEDVLQIRDMMKKRGYEVSCGLCYVEGSRTKMGEYTQAFIDKYKATNPDYVPTMAEINTATGQEKLRLEHPEVYAAYEYFMNHYGRLNEDDKALFASQQKPKMYQMATAYNGEILQEFKRGKKVARKNANGGLRLQSFSDFEIIHLIDCMQVIMDMSRVGLAGQAFTKVADFAKALGGTGLKINLSLIAKGVENGKIVLDEVEGMKRSDAEALRNKYSENVGTILVVFNDEQLKAAMADDFIDFIIPFHKSQWTQGLYEAMGLPKGTQDYTPWQNESYINAVYDKSGKKQRPKNYMPNNYWDFSKSGKENAEAYLKMCAENNRKPKFSNLLVNNGDGSYSLQPDGSTDGYWKTLIDFKMYDNNGKGVPQKAVTPNFNMEEAERMLKEYEGGHEKFPVAQDVVDDFVEEYKQKHPELARDDETDIAHYSSEYSPTAEDTAYLNAVNSGDMETAQKMVDEAAKKAGYNSPKLYHGTKAYGFTEFDLDAMDDGTSIFLTDNLYVAESYSGTLKTGTPGGRDGEMVNGIRASDIPTMPIKKALELYNQLHEHDGKPLSLVDKSELSQKIDSELQKIQKVGVAAQELQKAFEDSEYVKTFEEAFHLTAAEKTLTKELLKTVAAYSNATTLEEVEKANKQYELFAKIIPLDSAGLNIIRMMLGTDTLANSPRMLAHMLRMRSEKNIVWDKTGFGIWHESQIRAALEEDFAAETVTESYAMSANGRVRKAGNYALYAKYSNPLVIDCSETAWNEIIFTPPEIRSLKRQIKALQNTVASGKISAQDKEKLDFLTNELEKAAKELNQKYGLDIAGANKTRAITAYAEANNYDAVIFRDLLDVGEDAYDIYTGDIYTLFDANDIKSADPVTYDDSGNIIPLSERFNEKNKDIRYSEEYDPQFEMREDIRKEFADLKREAAAAKRQAAYWKGQTKTSPRTIRSSDINKVVNELAKNYGSTLKADDFRAKVQELADYILNHPSDTDAFSRASEMAENIARQVVDSATAVEGADDFDMALLDSPSSYYQSNAIDLIALDLMSDLMPLRETPRTFADRKKAELQNAKAKTREAYKLKLKNADTRRKQELAALRAEKNAKIEETRQQGLQEKQEAVSALRADRDAKIEALQEKARADLKTLRQQKNERYEELQEYYRQQKANTREKKQRAKMELDLLKIARRLQKMKLPLSLKAERDNLIGTLDLVARSITGKTINNLHELQAWYENQKKLLGENFIVNDTIEKKLDRLAKKQVSSYTNQELLELTEVLGSFLKKITEANEFVNSQIKADAYEAGIQTIRNIYDMPKEKVKLQSLLRPETAFRRFVGFDESSPMVTAIDEMIQGDRDRAMYERDAMEVVQKWVEDRKFMKSISGKNARALTLNGVDIFNKPIKQEVTPAMVIEMYLSQKNDDNMRHYTVGGIECPDMKAYRKGNIDDAYNDTTRVYVQRTDILDAAKQLTAEEKQFADAIYKYFNEFAPERLNKTSLALDGFERFYVENYYPIVVGRDFLKQSFEGFVLGEDYASLAQPGFTKERTESSLPVVLRDANLSLMQAIRMNAKYATMAVPLSNMYKLYNTTTVKPEMSVKNALRSQTIGTANKYIDQYLKDYAGMGDEANGAISKAARKARSLYAGGVLTFGMGTAIKQMASYPTAAAVTGWTPLIKALNPKFHADVSFIDKMTAAYTQRKQGFTDIERGDLVRQGKNLPKELNWIQAADLATTRTLKRAAYFAVKAETSLKVGSEEFKQAVVDKYNEVIEKTQPVYSTALRPGILRSKSELVRSVTMFKTQPLQNYNILYEAFGEYGAKARAYKNTGTAEALAEFKAARKNLVRATTSQFVSALLFALMQAGWNAARGKDKKYRDKEGRLRLGSAAFAKGVGLDILSNTAGMIPLASQFLEWGETAIDSVLKGIDKQPFFDATFYGLESVEFGAVNDAAKAAKTLLDLIIKVTKASIDEDTTLDWEDTVRKLLSSAENIGVMFGVPIGNITKDLQATSRMALKGMGLTKVMDEVEADYIANRIVNTTASDYYKQLYQYYKNNREKFSKLYDLMIKDDKLFTADKIKSALDNLMKKDENVGSVDLLEERFLSPQQKKIYDSLMDEAEDNPYWDDARGKVQHKIEQYARDAAEGKIDYDDIDLTYEQVVAGLLELDKVDEPNKSGNYGSYTADEVTKAVNEFGTLTDEQKFLLWDAIAPGQIKGKNPFSSSAPEDYGKEEEEEEEVPESVDAEKSDTFSKVQYKDGNLILTFRSGGTWTYKNVPQGVWEDMQAAESLGSFYHSYIKGNYDSVKGAA